MDIPKYIGLFLLKNNFCYLHGLGNLELKKKPAAYDGDALRAPEYNVVLSHGGSIDDTLANFIATHEQVSISKAANALRDFSMVTRAELAAGKEVELPGIGKFVDDNGLVRFVTNPHFQHVPPPVPMIRMAKRTEEQPDFRRDTMEETSGSQVAWGKVIMLVLLAVVVIAGGFFTYRYFSNNSTTPAAHKQDTVIAQPAVQPTPAVPVDTTAKKDTATPPPAPEPSATAAGGAYTVVLNSYPSRGAAERRVNTLTKNGNKVELLSRDSSTFMVVMHITSAGDTTRMLDSLRRFFNPKGVHILH
jgi:cell division septation protein DedD